MEKRTQRRKEEKETVLKEHLLGSWRLPSGNIVTGRLLHSRERVGLHMEIGDAYPLTKADLHVYGDFVVPEAQQRASVLLIAQKEGKRPRTKRRRI